MRLCDINHLDRYAKAKPAKNNPVAASLQATEVMVVEFEFVLVPAIDKRKSP